MIGKRLTIETKPKRRLTFVNWTVHISANNHWPYYHRLNSLAVSGIV